MADNWKVDKVTPTYAVGLDGRQIDVMRVDYSTANGSRGFITVPTAEFTVERVRELVEPAVAHLLAVEAL